jgi:arsenite methyltransferase
LRGGSRLEQIPQGGRHDVRSGPLDGRDDDQSGGAVDVVISNCVINLSVDKPAVLAEMFRVLRPGGRVGVSDVVAEDHLGPADRAERGSYVGCIAGALSRGEYLAGLAAAGFTDATVTFTHEAAPGMHSAIVRATKPANTTGGAASRTVNDDAVALAEAAQTCCSTESHAACDDLAAHALDHGVRSSVSFPLAVGMSPSVR